jgi:GT2 family glycosyltransferase
MIEQPLVAIVILNWNGRSDTISCLRSLYNINYKNYYIVIVDNNSADDSCERIRDYYEKDIGLSPSGSTKILEYTEGEAELGGGREKEIMSLSSNRRLILIKNNSNRGFAGGNNVGMRYALKGLNPKYILLLNNDTFVDPSFLGKLVEEIESDRKIGSVQPLLLKPGGKLIDSLGQALLITGAKDIEMGSKYENSLGKTEIFGPCAAAALYRSSALRDAGLFDESFFVMFEDVDLSWRIRLKGYSSFLVPSSAVYHKRGVSEQWQISGTKSRIIRYYNIKNWLIIAIRYYPSPLKSHMTGTFLHYLRWCMIYALKLGRSKEAIGQIYGSLIIRKSLSRNPVWTELQSRWIQSLSCDSVTAPMKP